MVNYWTTAPTRDEALDKIYTFLQLLSSDSPLEAEKLVRVGSMDKFRDALHRHLAEHITLMYDDTEYMELPDDLSTAIMDPFSMDENEIAPEFSGKQLTMVHRETVKVRVGLLGQLTPVCVHFTIAELDTRFYLNLMNVTSE
ncbi:MAG: hypothetical protein HYZ16_08670 [Bacteroidetes bacterium]|jgi:hypothetical protein|nr:hypothetical protein [Bacteroidota bacterium]